MTPETLARGKRIADEIGLPLIPGESGIICNIWYYRDDDIHRLLGEAAHGFRRDNNQSWHSREEPGDTERCFVIAVRPIKQESEERKLLRQVLERLDPDFQGSVRTMSALIEDVKRLLGER